MTAIILRLQTTRSWLPRFLALGLGSLHGAENQEIARKVIRAEHTVYRSKKPVDAYVFDNGSISTRVSETDTRPRNEKNRVHVQVELWGWKPGPPPGERNIIGFITYDFKPVDCAVRGTSSKPQEAIENRLTW